MRLMESWRREDRLLLTVLKVGLVAGVLILEGIVLASFAWLMWTTVR